MGLETAAVIGIAGAAAVGAVGATASTIQQRKAASATKKATREQRRIEEMQRTAEARERYRQLRRQRADVIQSAEYLGAAESTSAQSAVSGIQTAGNIAQGFASVTGQIANRMNAFSDTAQKANYNAGMYSNISQLGFGAAQLGLGSLGSQSGNQIIETDPRATVKVSQKPVF